MSTTTDKATALFYAKGGANKDSRGPAIVFEMQMGMTDRGANVAWLSEFPHEAEILFAPLTGMEVRGSRVEGAMQVYEVRLTVNMSALTIEQARRDSVSQHTHSPTKTFRVAHRWYQSYNALTSIWST